MLWVQLCAIAAAISLGLLWIIGRLAHRPAACDTMPAPPTGIARFLFEDDVMFDHDAGALPSGGPEAQHGLDWQQMRAWLVPRFDGLPASLLDLSATASVQLRSRVRDDTALLKLVCTEHGTQVSLVDPPHACPAERHEMLVAKARMDEISGAFETAPHPMWKTGPTGEILAQLRVSRRVRSGPLRSDPPYRRRSG